MRLLSLCIAVIVAGTPAFAKTAPFPGAAGWAAESTVGGRGGKIIRVTTLAADGPGSFKAALAATGPRTIVFEVGGVIDLARTTIESVPDDPRQ